MLVPTPPPMPPVKPPKPDKEPKVFIEQRLIVIVLRKKMFMEKQAVVQKELNEGWHVKDIQLGVGKMGTNGFMSILLEREYGLTVPPQHDDGTPFYIWHEETTETKYRDPHGLGDEPELYTMSDGAPIDDGEPIEPTPPDTEDINESDVSPDQPYTFNDDGPDLEEEENDDETQVVS